MKMKYVYIALALFCFAMSAMARAQEATPQAQPAAATAPTDPAAAAGQQAAAAQPATPPVPLVAGMTPDQLKEPFNDSLFLSPLEVALIQKAMRGEASSAQMIQNAASGTAPASARIIKVAGVLYRKPGDWIVWMNGQKLTPDNIELIPEIVDINVRSSSDVELEWFDAVMNQVLQITMRPQQTYDVATGILLPGAQ